MAVCDRNVPETAKSAKFVVPVCAGTDEALSLLNYCFPGELFIFYFALSKNLPMMRFDAHPKKMTWHQIIVSQIVAT